MRPIPAPKLVARISAAFVISGRAVAQRLIHGSGPFAPIIAMVIVLLLPEAVAGQPSRTVTTIPLGLAPGTFITIPNAINNRGDVVGQAATVPSLFVTDIPFLWTKERGFELILGHQTGTAFDINDRGEVIGTFEAADGTHGFLWRRGQGVIDLGGLQPTAINNHGTVAGNNCFGGPCFWKDGLFYRLPIPHVDVASINDREEITGSYFDSNFGNVGVIWSESGGVVPLEGAHRGVGINNAGVVVGEGRHPMGHYDTTPFVWTTRPTQQRYQPTATWGEARAINNQGQALVLDNYDPVLWNLRDQTRYSLYTACNGGACGDMNGTLIFATDINDKGQVAAWLWATTPTDGGSVQHEFRAFIITVGANPLFPVADVYVRGGIWASTNFSASPKLLAKRGSSNNTRRGYLKFDISDIDTIGRATLRLHGRVSHVGTSRVRTGIFSVRNQAWDEQTLTWSTKPAYGPLLGIATVRGTTPQWVEIDLTAFLQAEQRAGRNIVSVALRALEHTSAYAIFESREAGLVAPQLVITPRPE